MFLNDVDKLLGKIRKEGSYKITIPSNYDGTGLPKYSILTKEVKIPTEKIVKNSKKELENRIQRVKFDNPWTIVWWDDGSITRVKCSEHDIFTEESGLMAAICKHYFEDTNVFAKVLKKWCNPTSKYYGPKDIDTARKDGYFEGYDDGYTKGRSDSRIKEYKQAYSEGYTVGKLAAKANL